MRLQGRRRSTNVEDRRGRRPMGRRGAGIGCGGIILVILFALLTGNDPAQLLSMLAGAGGPAANVDQGPVAGVDPNDPGKVFVERVLADIERTWNDEFARMGRQYREPTLVLFEDAVQSACGFNSSAVGPFYCPADQRAYLDLTFFRQLEQGFGAPGDFARAYVIAHEVGHHVQNLLGISTQVTRMQQAARSREQANQLSVRLELQADCLAGVWGRQAAERGLLEPGDVEEGLRAAAAIGDDTIQKRSRGRVVPETFTHGSSAQRIEWFRIGLQSGDVEQCDTFGR